MREINFRFFDGKQMCEVGELTFFADNAGYHINSEFPSTGKDPYPLMQWTGLKDKNGKEIWEGDIVRCASSRKCAHEVVWMQAIPSTNLGGAPGFYLKGLNEGYAFGGEEIIGNIYQHPHLLK